MDASSHNGNSKMHRVKIDAELKDLIPSFLKNRRLDLVELPRALKAGDYETIERAGHGMKGSGLGFGFVSISEIGARMEKAAKVRDEGEVLRCLEELSHYIIDLEIIYE